MCTKLKVVTTQRQLPQKYRLSLRKYFERKEQKNCISLKTY